MDSENIKKPFRVIEHIIRPEEEGKQLYSVLKALRVSSAMIVRLKNTENGMTLNGEHIRTIDRVRAGGILRLNIMPDERVAISAGTETPVIYEDEDIIVFDKPPGMTVHPVHKYRTGTLTDAFATHLAKQCKAAAFRPLGRLDRDTSGLMLTATHQYAAARLLGGCRKTYFCICRGELTGSGTIDAPIRLMPAHGIQREVGEEGERAVTHYKVLSAANGFSSVSITLETGRTHQIRTHFAYLGHPLAGDTMYGGDEARFGSALMNGFAVEMPRQALHCDTMEIIHPVSDQIIRVFSEIPEDIAKFASLHNLTIPYYKK